MKQVISVHAPWLYLILLGILLPTVHLRAQQFEQNQNATVTTWPISPPFAFSDHGARGCFFLNGRFYMGWLGITEVNPATNQVTRWAGGDFLPWGQLGLPLDGTIPFGSSSQGLLGILNTTTNIATAWQTGRLLKPVLARSGNRLYGITNTTLVEVNMSNNQLTEFNLAALGLGNVASSVSGSLVFPLTAMPNGRVATVLSSGTALRLVIVDPTTSVATVFELPYQQFNSMHQVSNLAVSEDNRIYGAVQLLEPAGSSVGTVAAFRLDPASGELISLHAGAWPSGSLREPATVSVSPDGSRFHVINAMSSFGVFGFAHQNIFNMNVPIVRLLFNYHASFLFDQISFSAVQDANTFWHAGRAAQVKAVRLVLP